MYSNHNAIINFLCLMSRRLPELRSEVRQARRSRLPHRVGPRRQRSHCAGLRQRRPSWVKNLIESYVPMALRAKIKRWAMQEAISLEFSNEFSVVETTSSTCRNCSRTEALSPPKAACPHVVAVSVRKSAKAHSVATSRGSRRTAVMWSPELETSCHPSYFIIHTRILPSFISLIYVWLKYTCFGMIGVYLIRISSMIRRLFLYMIYALR